MTRSAYHGYDTDVFGGIPPLTVRHSMPKDSATWQNRIVGYGEEPPDQLLANPLNFRTHPKNQQDTLSGVLSEVGIVQNVLVNKRTGYVIDGHLRISLAMREHQPTVPVTYVDLTPAEESLILATLDPISAMAFADAGALDALLREVSTSDAAVMQMLSDLAEENGVVGFGGSELLTNPDEVPEPPVDPITRPGDLWLLGRHRLLCGDSTNAADVARLMGGESFDLLLTDPPYGLGIDGQKLSVAANPKHNRKAHDFRGWDSARPSSDLFAFALTLTKNAMIFGGNYFADLLPASRGWVYWDKGQNGLTMSDGELVWTSIDKPLRAVVCNRANLGNTVHPTQKPVQVIEFCLDYADGVDTVLDLFGGSGSTLIACEQTGRRCAMMELDPQYCDVIVTRWENATGQTATRESVAMAAD